MADNLINPLRTFAKAARPPNRIVYNKIYIPTIIDNNYSRMYSPRAKSVPNSVALKFDAKMSDVQTVCGSSADPCTESCSKKLDQLQLKVDMLSWVNGITLLLSVGSCYCTFKGAALLAT